MMASHNKTKMNINEAILSELGKIEAQQRSQIIKSKKLLSTKTHAVSRSMPSSYPRVQLTLAHLHLKNLCSFSDRLASK